MLSAQRYALTVILIKANDLINFYGLDTLMGTGYCSGIRCTERNFLKCPLNCIDRVDWEKSVYKTTINLYAFWGSETFTHTHTTFGAHTHAAAAEYYPSSDLSVIK